MSFKKIFATVLVAALFSVKSFSQFTATWAFTSNNTGSKAGVNLADISISDAIPGAAFTSNLGYSTGNGIKCQPTSGNDWPTTPTDGWHIDFPISPVGSMDATLLGLTFAARTSGSSGNNMVSLAVQKDGTGPFVPFGTPQSVAGGGLSTITFPAFAKKIYNGHLYVVRMYMYAANSGTSASRSLSVKNEVFNGTVAAAGTQPIVTTASVNATGKYTATATGVVTAGTYSVTSSGVVWGLSANPTVALATKTTNGPTVSGNINLANGGAITGLTAGTNYNVRAYVISETDSVTYGANLAFTTDAPTKPDLTTTAVTNITSVKATSGGVIIDSGGVGITAKGVCWSTLPNPTTADPKTTDGVGNAAYSSLMKILNPSTKYYVRAYATNSIGTAYGDEINFTTLAPEPIIATVTPNGQNSIPFGDVVVNNTSAVKSYTLSASALNPATGAITINAPTGFEISTNPGTGFASTLTINYSSSTITSTTIYVRFVPTQFGDYSGVITHTGGGATSINIDDVTVTGKGIQDPSNFSNTGTEFWVGYATHNLMGSDGATIQSNGGDQTMVLYLSNSTNQSTSVFVDIPGLSFTSGLITVAANSVYTYTIPNQIGSSYAQLYQEGKSAKGIHITSVVPIVVYAHIYGKLVSGASLLLPVNTWGIDYYASSYNQRTSSGSSNTGSYNYFFVIANQDSTDIEITPTVSTLGGWSANPTTPYTVRLNKGEVYNVLATKIGGEDVTGSRIKSIDCNKKIAVFSGSGRTGIQGSCNTNLSSDNLFAQVFPNAAWGTKYLTTPTMGTTGDNIFRVYVRDTSTNVNINGALIPKSSIINNFYYEIINATDPQLIEANKPISVAQYTTSVDGCTNGSGRVSGDPEMIFISPVQQAIDHATLFSPSNQQIATHYINVIIPKSGVNGFELDGVNKASKFVQHIRDTNYYHAVFDATDGVVAGQHTIKSNVAFNAIAYGFGDANSGGSNPIRESYGYNAGTQLKPLTQFLSVNNSYPNLTNDSLISACLNNNFKYKVYLPYKPLSMHWDFFNNTIQLPNADTVLVTNPVPVDSAIINGAMLYQYSLPTTYTFNSTGTFPVNITVNATNADGCSGLQTITFNVKVVEPPVAHFLLDYLPCLPTILNYADSSYDKNGIKMAGREWTFSGFTPVIYSSDSAPTISYNSPGNYDIKLRAINAIGCYKDTIATVTLYSLPTVTNIVASSNGPSCVGKSVTFTTTATASLGTIVKYYWNFGDGTKDTTTTDTVSHTYTTANITGFTVSVFVETSVGCVSSSYSILQSIHLLKADFTLVSPKCVNTLASFNDASVGVNVTSPVTASWLWSFGDPGNNTATTQNASFTYTTDNTYTVKLRVALSNSGTEFCFDTISKQIVITPTINITSVTTNPAGPGCVNKAITYTAAGNAAAGSFKWYWDFGDGKKDTTTTNTTTHTFTSTATPFNVKVFAQLTGGCKGNTISYEQYIYKVTAIPSFVSPQCINTPVVFTDNSTGTVTSALIDTKWDWTLQGATPANATTQNALASFASAGSYNIKLKTYLVFAGNEFCSHDSTKTLVVNDVLAKPAVVVDNAATTLNSLTFNWAAIAGATGYQVSFNGGSWITPSSGATGLTHTATGLSNATTYSICVKALGSCPSDSTCISGKTATPNSELFIPNVFTPDNNGRNDKLIVCSNNIKSVQFVIYSQWGEKLYETTNPTINAQGCYEVWDGKAYGKIQPVGVYAYVAVVTMNDGKVLNKKGLVNLVR